jgi:antitoxin (DNA-binding transcriptional repressor) of toxin-antitoxin stability system
MFCITMKTASVRELRNNFAKISRWLKAGEKVEITKRGAPYAKIELTAPVPKKKKRVSEMTLKERRAFFRKRFGAEHRQWMKETYGGKTLPGNGVLIMREGSRW